MFIQAKITGARTEQVTKTRKEGANVTTSATNRQYDPTKVVLLSLSPIYNDK